MKYFIYLIGVLLFISFYSPEMIEEASTNTVEASLIQSPLTILETYKLEYDNGNANEKNIIAHVVRTEFKDCDLDQLTLDLQNFIYKCSNL